MYNIFAIATAYLLGSFPSAYVIGRILKRIDIRETGSGNVGGMNIYRAAGFLPGILTVLLDIGKGVLAVLLAVNWSEEPLVVFMAGLLVVLGHNYSVFLRFKGGKGLATGLGVFIALSPITIPFLLLAALCLTIVLRDTNTAFGASTLSIPLILYFQYQEAAWVLFSLAFAVIILTKHIQDFQAYRKGRRKII